MLEFEWDENKSAENLRKHKISFRQATPAFSDPLALEDLDESEDYGEARFHLVGMCTGSLLTVVFTIRQSTERIRIISARKSNKNEEQDYYSQIAR